MRRKARNQTPKRGYRVLNFFLPLAFSVILPISHLGASESLNDLAGSRRAIHCRFNKLVKLFPIPLPLSIILGKHTPVETQNNRFVYIEQQTGKIFV